MKAAKTLIESLADMDEVSTSGDLRRINANAMLALARKEISATDAEAMAKLMDSISNNMNAEVKITKMKIELREHAAELGKVVHLGRLLIASAPRDGDPPKAA